MSEILKQPKVLCWDLDHTLGQFFGLGYSQQTNRSDIPREYRKLTKRFGLDDVLDRLSDQGFIHCLSTAASNDYAQMALQKTSLDRHFRNNIWDRKMLQPDGGGGKQYSRIGEQFFKEVELHADNMLAIGDSYGDYPSVYDSPRMVFLFQQDGYQYDATTVEIIIQRLLLAGNQSFYQGFRNLYNGSQPVARDFWHGADNLLVSQVTLGNGIELDLGYVNFAGYRKSTKEEHPVISNILAPAYLKPPEVVETLFPD